MKKKEKLGLNQFLSNAETAKGSMQKFSGQTSVFDIDYSEFEVTEDEKQELIKCEHDISHHLKNIGQHMLWYYDALYQANEIFSNHKTGYWGKWLEKIGIKKSKANIAIRKYKLYLQGKYSGNENQQVLELPDRAVIKMTGEDEIFVKTEIAEIISAENPKEKFKDIESKKNIEYRETKEFWQKELEKKEKQLNKIKEEIKKVKEKLQNL